MADDLDASVPSGAVATDPPVTPPAEVPPPDPDEQDAVELPAGKHVPLAALKSVRAENAALKAKAAENDSLRSQLAQATPYVQFLQQNPQLMQRPQEPLPPAPVGGDPDLVELAKSLDYYTPQGQPDLDRAQRHLGIVQREARKMAEQIVGPLAQSTYQDASTRNWQAAVQEKLPNGQPIDQTLLRAAWGEVARQNPAMTADPRVARVIVNTVMAEQWRTSPLGAPPPAPPGPPVRTEHTGSGPRQPRTAMTDAERAIVKGRMTDDKYTALTKDFVKGRTNVLEED